MAEEPGSRLAASITDRLTIRPATELVEVPAAPIVRKPQPARPPLSLIDKLAEFDCELSIADFASIYIDGNRSLKLKCRALKYAVKTHGIPFHGLGKRMKFDPVELIEYIRRRSFTAKKPPRAKGRDITRRIAARKK